MTIETHTNLAPKILVLDLETTGLKAHDGDMILEVGMVAFDYLFQPVGEFQCVVNGAEERLRWDLIKSLAPTDVNAKIVTEMHTKSGLGAEIDNNVGIPLAEAEQAMTQWCHDVGVAGLPITGSNAKFDRGFLAKYMPTFDDNVVHYRSLDVSSIKEWARAFFPDQYAEVRAGLSPRQDHRSIADCYDTRNELRAYTELFGKYFF